MSRVRYGYKRIHVLLRREGICVNKKRVHRLYRLEGLHVRMRARRKKDMTVAFAENGTLEPVSDLEKFVYSEEAAQ